MAISDFARTAVARRLCLTITAWLIAAGALPAAAEPPAPRLERVVILMRHGVRAAMASPADLGAWNGRTWPAFAVPAGHLTRKGGRLVTLLGRYYRERYTAAGLLRPGDCAVHYHANLTQRTEATAAALAEGLTPGCRATVNRVAAGPDPLFDAPLTPLAPPHPALAQAAMMARIGGDLAAWDARQRDALARFERLLLHCASVCTEEERARAPQRLDRLPIAWTRGTDGMPAPTSPALGVAGLAESLLMGYADGQDFARFDWGFDAQALTAALVVHGAGIDLRLRTPEIGRQASSYLAYRLLATLQAGTGTHAASAPVGRDEKIVVLSGHDGTLNMLAGLLGFDWLLPSYAAGQAAPGGGLVFERWRRADGRRVVRLFYIAQGLDQLREERPLSLASPPEIAAVAIPGCALGDTLDCPIEGFAALVASRADRRRAGLPAQ